MFNEAKELSIYHEHLLEILEEKCKPFLDFREKNKIDLWRGVTSNFLNKYGKLLDKEVFLIKHKNRKPVDTPTILHDRLNSKFKEKFGWNVRDGVFCLPDKGIAQSYAEMATLKSKKWDYPEAYLVVPVGEFDYCWSPEYKDLTADIKVGNKLKWSEHMNNITDKRIQNIVNTYKNTDIEDANYVRNSKKYKDSASEISLNCKEYILISPRYFVNVGTDFSNWKNFIK